MNKNLPANTKLCPEIIDLISDNNDKPIVGMIYKMTFPQEHEIIAIPSYGITFYDYDVDLKVVEYFINGDCVSQINLSVKLVNGLIEIFHKQNEIKKLTDDFNLEFYGRTF